MKLRTDNLNTQYLAKWLALDEVVSPLIIASYSSDILKDTIEYAAHLNKDNDTLYLQEDNNSYKIKETRELINTISRKSFVKQRLIVIELAEKLTLPAVNALLKSLEEPFIQNKWILTTKQLPLILPTIRSRCQILRINDEAPLSEHNDSHEFWQELMASKKADRVSDEALLALHNYLTKKLRSQGTNPHIYRVLLRLRDYHKIKSHRGNTKLARDVLLASLYQLRNT